jgi:hypothetical protein
MFEKHIKREYRIDEILFILSGEFEMVMVILHKNFPILAIGMEVVGALSPNDQGAHKEIIGVIVGYEWLTVGVFGGGFTHLFQPHWRCFIYYPEASFSLYIYTIIFK